MRGSGNIYRDFKAPDADVRQLKAILASERLMNMINGLGSRVEVAVKVRQAPAGQARRAP